MDEQCTSAQWGQSPYEVTLEFLSFFFHDRFNGYVKIEKSTGWTINDLLFLEI